MMNFFVFIVKSQVLCDIPETVLSQYDSQREKCSGHPITLSRQNWDASKLDVALGTIILGSVLGMKIEVVDVGMWLMDIFITYSYVDEKSQFPLLVQGDIDVCLEFWYFWYSFLQVTMLRTQNNADVIAEYIDTGELETSSLGVIGQIGENPRIFQTDN